MEGKGPYQMHECLRMSAATAPHTVSLWNLSLPTPPHLHLDTTCSKAGDFWAIHLQPSPDGARGPSLGDARTTHFLNVTGPSQPFGDIMVKFPNDTQTGCVNVARLYVLYN